MNVSNFKQRVKRSLDRFWLRTLSDIELNPWHYKELHLPLARIKRLMKVEEEVKMVASEVPVIFAKITEVFIQELTLRAWINTEENKRRILQKNDLCSAVKTSDVYDFLVFIIPRNELESTFSEYTTFHEFENKLNGYYGTKTERAFNTGVNVREDADGRGNARGHEYADMEENKALRRQMVNDELYRGKGERDINETLATDEMHARILAGGLHRNMEPGLTGFEHNKVNTRSFIEENDVNLFFNGSDMNQKDHNLNDNNQNIGSIEVKRSPSTDFENNFNSNNLNTRSDKNTQIFNREVVGGNNPHNDFQSYQKNSSTGPYFIQNEMDGNLKEFRNNEEFKPQGYGNNYCDELPDIE